MSRGLKAAGIVVFLALLAWLTYQVKREEAGGGGGRQTLGQVAVGDPAPDFTLEDLDGEEVSLNDYRAQVVVLDFWATWCPPCRMVMPVLDSFSEKHRNSGVAVLSLNQGEGRDHVEKALKGREHGFRVLLDIDEEVGDAYGVTAIPVLVMVDREGKISWIKVGYSPDLEDQLTEQLKALAEPSGEGERQSHGRDQD